ncbi:MAG: tetratricopeptide repeat protein, partial [Acidobacteriota bacterium]
MLPAPWPYTCRMMDPAVALGAPPTAPPPSGRRLWLFRLLATTLLPLLLLLAVEGLLHLAGYGDSSAFLVPIEGRQDALTTNQRFGWRFFPRRLARTPLPLEISTDGRDGRRLFVLGGSAARGTPDSAYNFGRMLAVLLADGWPEERFTVHNTAMTAINSHVVREIARDCAPRAGDVLVIYLGNNEVVGPYGAGTVFGSFSSYLPVIRATIRLRASRIGQLLGNVLGQPAAGPVQWRGMELFLEQQVAADDPRLAKVYRHFERNLTAIVRNAHRAGATTILVTVAANLRDQPPFASAHRPELTDDERRHWQALYATGRQASAAGDAPAALAAWRQASAIDDRYAELHFRIGRVLLDLGQVEEARLHLSRARDLDTLRFRADSRINDTLRRVAEDESERRVSLVDAATLFAGGSAEHPPLPGNRLFHEHVHLNFDGNLALATAVYEHLQSNLQPTVVRTKTVGQTKTAAQEQATAAVARQAMADRLVYTPFDRIDLERAILRIVSRPPFTGQLDHAAAVEGRWQAVARLQRELGAAAWPAADELYRQRLGEDPGDMEIRRRYATHLQNRQHSERAAEHWRILLDRLPHISAWRAALATSLADADRGEDALIELEGLEQRDGESAELWVSRGTIIEGLGREGDAAAAYARALEIHPRHDAASFNLATAALRRGEIERAADLYRELLEHHPDFARAHHNLGRCLEELGQHNEALAAYTRALDADPTLASAHNSLGLARERRGDPQGAAAAYRRALLFEPAHALAHFNLADLELGRGQAATAASHYQQGLEQRPDNVQARYNL